MDNKIEMLQALKQSFDNNIAAVERLLNGNVVSISLFFQGTDKHTLNAFSHQVLFGKNDDLTLIKKSLNDYKFQLMAERSIVIDELNRLAVGELIHEA